MFEATATSDSSDSVYITPAGYDRPDSRYYSFPFSHEDFCEMQDTYDDYTSDKYIEDLQNFSYEKFDASGQRFTYEEIRRHVILFSIMLNLKGEIAPRFRPMRSPATPLKGLEYPAEHSMLSNDRQMIDLHWIYCKGLHANNIKGYNGLFNKSKPFDLMKASMFVNKAGGYVRKANLLGLPEFEQFQLASIQSTEVKTRSRTINNYCERHQSKLKDLFTGSMSKYKEETIRDIPDIHKAILIARGSPTYALKMYALMTGKTENIKNIQRYTQKLKASKLVM